MARRAMTPKRRRKKRPGSNLPDGETCRPGSIVTPGRTHCRGPAWRDRWKAQAQPPPDVKHTAWKRHLDTIADELVRLTAVCDVDLRVPGAIDRVLGSLSFDGQDLSVRIQRSRYRIRIASDDRCWGGDDGNDVNLSAARQGQRLKKAHRCSRCFGTVSCEHDAHEGLLVLSLISPNG